MDEAKGATLAFSPLSAWWEELPNHQAPPGHFLLLKWIGTLSRTEWALRLPSAIAAWLCLISVWEIGKRLNLSLPSLPALLLSVSPLFFNFSQEARCYTLWTLAELSAWTALLRWSAHPDDRKSAQVAGLLSFLPLLLHYYALWFLLGRIPLLIGAWRRSNRGSRENFAATCLISAVISLPWLFHQIESMPPPNPNAITRASEFGLPFLTRKLGEFFGLDYPLWPLGWAILLGALGGVFIAVRGERDRQLSRLFYFGFLFPPVCILISMLASERYLATRHLLPMLPIALIALSQGLLALFNREGLGIRIAVVGVTLLLVATSLGESIRDRREVDRPPWRSIAEHLAGEKEGDGRFVLIGDNVSVLMFYRDEMGIAFGEAEMSSSDPENLILKKTHGIILSGQSDGAEAIRERFKGLGIQPEMEWTSRRISPIEYYAIDDRNRTLLKESVEEEIRSHS
ncbi:MAG: glycosyltransferase family 39 protein [Candidatus Omnitrophica bacterium]|nr:glycosyltransferase family 39 protein [Candidatus Omnitrophota bacterium]